MHINANPCPACNDKLKAVHPDLVRWVNVLRSTHPDAHVSCGYRGQSDQEADFQKGVSRAHFGQSAHNCAPAMAVDLFRITQTGGASFDRPWYEGTIAPIAKAAGLVWGGDWKSIKDMPHVELPGFEPFKS
jgi:peptidoglycan L-alanyl-D-glutamate endopeptidase CwlK